MDIVQPANPVLTHADRCDFGKCGARAYVKAYFALGKELSDLYMCAHHFAVSQDALARTALTVIDERHLLNVKLESGAHD